MYLILKCCNNFFHSLKSDSSKTWICIPIQPWASFLLANRHFFVIENKCRTNWQKLKEEIYIYSFAIYVYPLFFLNIQCSHQSVCPRLSCGKVVFMAAGPEVDQEPVLLSAGPHDLHASLLQVSQANMVFCTCCICVCQPKIKYSIFSEQN